MDRVPGDGRYGALDRHRRIWVTDGNSPFPWCAGRSLTRRCAPLLRALRRRDARPMTTAAVAEVPPRSMRMWSARPQRWGSVVRRPALVRRLADPTGPPLAVLVAPAGY